MQKISIFWFRRDLRLEDNKGLSEALKADEKVDLKGPSHKKKKVCN